MFALLLACAGSPEDSSPTLDDTGTPSDSEAPLECDEGYQPDATGEACEDIDECAEELADCADWEACANTEGSFECAYAGVNAELFPLQLDKGDVYGQLTPGPDGSFYLSSYTLGSVITIGWDGSQTETNFWVPSQMQGVWYDQVGEQLYMFGAAQLYAIDIDTVGSEMVKGYENEDYLALARAPEGWGDLGGRILVAGKRRTDGSGAMWSFDPADPSGTFEQLYLADEYGYPTALAFDDSGQLWMTDWLNGLAKVSPEGGVEWVDSEIEADGLQIVGDTAYLAISMDQEIHTYDLATGDKTVMGSFLIDGGNFPTAWHADGFGSLVVLEYEQQNGTGAVFNRYDIGE